MFAIQLFYNVLRDSLLILPCLGSFVTDDSNKSSALEIIPAFKILVVKSSLWAIGWLMVSSGLAVSLTSLFSLFLKVPLVSQVLLA